MDNNNKDDFEMAENYVLNKLSLEDQILFKERLKHDNDLKAKVVKLKAIRKVIIDKENIKLKKLFIEIENKNKKRNKTIQYSIAASFLLLLGVGIIYFSLNKNNTKIIAKKGNNKRYKTENTLVIDRHNKTIQLNKQSFIITYTEEVSGFGSQKITKKINTTIESNSTNKFYYSFESNNLAIIYPKSIKLTSKNLKIKKYKDSNITGLFLIINNDIFALDETTTKSELIIIKDNELKKLILND